MHCVLNQLGLLVHYLENPLLTLKVHHTCLQTQVAPSVVYALKQIVRFCSALHA